MSTASNGPQTVALITLGCARNEVDSEELAGRLQSAGWVVVPDADDAQAILVNTCGFIDAAKADSIETIMAATHTEEGEPAKVVVAVGCMAQRYGSQLASALPEARAVLSFDDYPDIAERLTAIVEGRAHEAHSPTDRRKLLPITPVSRHDASVSVPGHGRSAGESGPEWNNLRMRLSSGPVAALKIASGCDRRCSFCAIPAFRGAFVSRDPADIVSEAQWLVGQGVREVVLVSENSTSFGKDLGDQRLLERLLADLGEVAGLGRVRVSYLQPAEVKPTLISAIIDNPRVADYFDLSFQHASAPLLRTMRRFGGTADFLDLIGRIRSLRPQSGIRSNFIVGFPGESQADFDELADFLGEAQLDAIGVFGYSDEEGTHAATMTGHVPDHVIRSRVDELSSLADELMSQRAEQRVGQLCEVLVESVTGSSALGHSGFQGPDDGQTTVTLIASQVAVKVGDWVRARIVSSDGVDLIAVEDLSAG